MERRRALTIPFNVDKDNRMENPFKISMPCVSSQCGKLERQVPWTAFADCKRRHCSSQHINGSMLFDHNHATLEMVRRKPRLILTDVLETEQGKAYMERMKPGRAFGNRMSSTRRESGRSREEPLICRDMRSRQRDARNDENMSVTPQCNQKIPSSPTHRSSLRRRSWNVDDEVDIEENKDIEEVILGKDNGDNFKFAEVVVSWEPALDTECCEEFSPARFKDRLADPEKQVQHSLKRRRKDAGAQYNGMGSPKRHRESVLRLTGEDRRDGGRAPTRVCLEESGEDGGLESLDRTIVQFTVGADDPTEVLVPTTCPNMEAVDSVISPRTSRSSSQDNTSINSPSEPIVLSSDDEESGDPASNTLVTVEDAVIQGQSPQEAVAKQLEASDIGDVQVLRVVVDLPSSVAVSSIPSIDYSFYMLHCGGHQGKANGDVMIAGQHIIIPLTDIDEQVEVILTLERKDLWRYSVWEQQELEERELRFKDDDEPSPVAVLLFCVSESAALAIQRELMKLCANQDGNTSSDKVSPFILLTLRHPVEGMEGALLRSLLDIDCLNSPTHEKYIHSADKVVCLEDFHSPVLSLDDSIELIRRTGLDSHLLSLLGLEFTDSDLDSDQEGPHSDTDRNSTPRIQLDVESEKETELETETEQDTETQLKTEEDQKEQELQHPSDEKKLEPAPVYTLCHHRTKGSYSVSLYKPDPSLTKFKHQGLARRLIQFPPPPLKGGITVTLEDLRCLDSGHFLNDVIIDFYLKYVLQNASAAVAERSHIFSSFFYKQLTRRDNASEGVTNDSCQRQRRHQRVKTWTRHVDIFKKDFLFVPVNQEAHWYLVVICFPGMDEPQSETRSGPNGELLEQEVAQGSESPNDNTETPPTLNHSDSLDTDTEKPQEDSTKDPLPRPVNCTEQTCKKKAVSKRPCILIMDSLKLSLHERVFKLLRDYLQSEWEVRRGSSRDFNPDQMQSSHCKVPLQDNSSDCGLYLLQYVESFLKDPVVHFDLPLHLQQWFPRQQVRRKRDEIRDLVLNLHRDQNLGTNR
ncbi:sentrin-specific protease 7 isoform X2 [Anoplopoma fimbria]|uniref:sentrin-specific protease 7 isoform X2 n=1 Tax=Anoplopoma fimbria TaxID=229290 RepID=UPI0023EA941B|nr:sentrin-specific protease 7 isoform X2 [Anoplopoma fimbria]